MSLACIIGLLDIFLLTGAKSISVAPTVVEAQLDLVSVFVRSPSGLDPQPSALLSAGIGVRIPGLFRGTKVRLSRIEFFDEQQEPIGGNAIGLIRSSGTWLPGIPLEADGRELFVPPASPTVLSFRAAPDDAVSLPAGSKIYAEVSGRIGEADFQARSDQVEAGTSGEDS